MRAATTLSPEFSNRVIICPMTFFATASGLMMDRVLSTAILILQVAKFNLSGSNSPPLGANTFADVFGFDTPRLAAGLFIPASDDLSVRTPGGAAQSGP